MQYKASDITALIKQASESYSELMVGGTLTEAYSSLCSGLGTAIAQAQSTFQSSTFINNIQVFGGSCSQLGALTGGKGLGVPGSFSGAITGLSGLCISQFPTSAMADITPSLRNLVSAIGQGFQNVFNSFIQTSVISDIEVSGGTCTCQIISGTPVPGTYFGGTGKLSSLTSVPGITISKGILYNNISALLDSTTLGQGTLTEALKASLDAVCTALAEYHSRWLANTKIDNIQVNGGVTIPSGPIAGASGSGGQLI